MFKVYVVKGPMVGDTPVLHEAEVVKITAKQVVIEKHSLAFGGTHLQRKLVSFSPKEAWERYMAECAREERQVQVNLRKVQKQILFAENALVELTPEADS